MLHRIDPGEARNVINKRNIILKSLMR